MTEILTITATALVLLAGLAALVHYARRDSLHGPVPCLGRDHTIRPVPGFQHIRVL